jgi:hypothetical protein
LHVVNTWIRGTDARGRGSNGQPKGEDTTRLVIIVKATRDSEAGVMRE